MDLRASTNEKLPVQKNRKLEKLLKENEKCKEMARREETYCKINAKKFDEKWHEIFSQSKNEELKYLIGESSKVFEHIVNIKDEQIDWLLQQMNFTNEQYLQMYYYVTEAMDNHILLFQKNLLTLKKEYEDSLSAKLAEIKREREEIAEQQLNDNKSFEKLIKEMENCRDNEQIEINDHFLSIFDEDQKNNDSKCENTKVQLGQAIDELINEIVDVIDKHLKETNKRKSEVKNGMEHNRKTRESIVEMQQQLINSYNLLEEKKVRLTEIDSEYREQIPKLERDKSETLKQLDAVKLDHEEKKKFFANQLRELVINSNREIHASLKVVRGMELPEEIKEMGIALHDMCQKETSVSEDLIESAKKGSFSEDQTLKCYLKCILSQSGLIDDDGNIDVKTINDIIPPEMEEFKHVAVTCGTVKGSDACDTAYLAHVCFYKTDPKVIVDFLYFLHLQKAAKIAQQF